MNIVAGLDLGQSQDHAALVVGRATISPLMIGVGHVHQFPLKTSYATILSDVAGKINAAGLDVDLAVDARGPGKPIVDMLAIMPGLRVGRLLAVSNTNGRQARRESPRDGDPAILERWSVPKSLLLGTLVRVIRSGRFGIANTAGAGKLKQEFENFGFKFTDAGNLKFDAITGHDDILLSLVLLVWAAVTGGNP